MAGAPFYTRCLEELPTIKISDVHRIVKERSKASNSLLDKGFRLYVSSYIFNYEGESHQSFLVCCHRHIILVKTVFNMLFVMFYI